jgi:transposase
MILFLNRNDEKWPHTRQVKIAGRNHILPPLGIAWKTKHGQIRKSQLKLNVKLSENDVKIELFSQVYGVREQVEFP